MPPTQENANEAARRLSADVDFFLTIPWCRALLQPDDVSQNTQNGQNTQNTQKPPKSTTSASVKTMLPYFRRSAPPAPGPDGTVASDPAAISNAFNATLNTRDTISHFVLFYTEPPRPPAAHPDYQPLVMEISGLLHLGPGVNGHVGVAHGGLVAAVLDEMLGLIVPINRMRFKHNRALGLEPPFEPPSGSKEVLSASERAAIASAATTEGFVTGYLNTTYVRPVYTSRTILATARYVRMEGTRKFYFEGDIRDDKGTVLTKGECVYIMLRDKL